MKRQTTEKTPPTSAADMPERVIAELDRHLAELEIADKRLADEDRALYAAGVEPVEPSASQIRLQDRARAFQNGFAPEIPGLTAAERMWVIGTDRRAIAQAIAAGQNAQRRAAISLIAGALANHDARMRRINPWRLWLIDQLQAANRETAASVETAMIEARGMLDYRAVPWRNFDLLGLGDGTGESGQSGEAYEFKQQCAREGVRAAAKE